MRYVKIMSDWYLEIQRYIEEITKSIFYYFYGIVKSPVLGDILSKFSYSIVTLLDTHIWYLILMHIYWWRHFHYIYLILLIMFNDIVNQNKGHKHVVWFVWRNWKLEYKEDVLGRIIKMLCMYVLQCMNLTMRYWMWIYPNWWQFNVILNFD